MSYKEFVQDVDFSVEKMCRRYFRENRDRIQIKKEETAVKNMVLIINAALKLSLVKGFQEMSLRDLSGESGLSMGALYSYINSKDELLSMIHDTGQRAVIEFLEKGTESAGDPLERLKSAVRTHLYMSEMMQPWFYFFFMETKNLSGESKKKPMESEQRTEKIFIQLLKECRKAGNYSGKKPELFASVIKAMMQDWYLKRWKYRGRKISVDEYADYILEIILARMAIEEREIL